MGEIILQYLQSVRAVHDLWLGSHGCRCDFDRLGSGLLALYPQPAQQQERQRHHPVGLCQSLALGLEFKLGGEILRTVMVRDWQEIGIVAAIITLRALLNFIIHGDQEYGIPLSQPQGAGMMQTKILIPEFLLPLADAFCPLGAACLWWAAMCATGC